jgi:GNAT superfamily N-acetyltransferase
VTPTERIRAARSDDLQPIVRLCGQLGYPAQAPTIADRLAGLLGEQRHAVLVAERAGEGVVGLIHVYTDIWLVMGETAEVGGLVVAEGSRGEGTGARLLGAAERWAAARGCTRLVVRTNAVRERAHRFYERQGYALLKTQRVYARLLPLPQPGGPSE